MNSSSHVRLAHTFKTLAERYPGPGAAVAVLRSGVVLESTTWGWADAERHLPFSPQTMTLICSITKQFTCGLLLDQFSDPTLLDQDLRQKLPYLQGPVPAVLDLCHNQSGLRDYWAQAMLCGAAVEGSFGAAEARRLLEKTRSLQFLPGTRYSYANQNFRLLSELLEERTGQEFAALLRNRIFDRAGMPHAQLNPDTSHVAGGTVGYEGSPELGFRPAVNRIHWTGDAGIAASLEDMVAWEQFIDATRADATGLYRRLSTAPRFRDGSPAFYGFGLGHMKLKDHAATCHGGGLRGWRSFRLYAPVERISVVVLFNHMADPRAAAMELFAAALDEPAFEVPGATPATPDPQWLGRYLDAETGLAAHLEMSQEQGLRFHYTSGPEPMARSINDDLQGSQTRLYREAGSLRMDRPRENLNSTLVPCQDGARPDIEGRFHCAELDAMLTCSAPGGVLYGAFSGALGEGTMQALLPFGADVWLLPCPRALDFEAPGDWTLRFERDASGYVSRAQVGCWLARNLEFVRV
jgi:D-aminopeptidase